MTCENCEVPEGYVAVVHVPVTAEEVERQRSTSDNLEKWDDYATTGDPWFRPSDRLRAAILRLPVPPPPIEVGCRVRFGASQPAEVRGINTEWGVAWLLFEGQAPDTFMLSDLTHASDCPNHGSGT